MSQTNKLFMESIKMNKKSDQTPELKPVIGQIDILDLRYFPANFRAKISEFRNKYLDKIMEYENIFTNIFWNKHLNSILSPNSRFNFKLNHNLIRLVWLFYSESFEIYKEKAFLLTLNFFDFIVDLFLDYLDEYEDNKDKEPTSDDLLVLQYKLNIDLIVKNKKFFQNKKKYPITLEYLNKYKRCGLDLVRESDVEFINKYKQRKNKRKQIFDQSVYVEPSKPIEQIEQTEHKSKKFKVQENSQLDKQVEPINKNIPLAKFVSSVQIPSSQSQLVYNQSQLVQAPTNNLININQFSSSSNQNPFIDKYYKFLSESPDPYLLHRHHKIFLNFIYDCFIKNKIPLVQSYLDVLQNESNPSLYHRDHLEHLNSVFDEFRKRNNVYPNMNNLHVNYFGNLTTNY